MKLTGWSLAVAATAVLGVACSRSEPPEEATPAATNEGGYPAPRYPAYYVKTSVDSLESIMPYARNLARNKASTRGAGLGLLQPGESVAIVTNVSADPNVMEAIRLALEERQVKAHILYEHELAGVSKEDALALQTARAGGYNENGYQEAVEWIEGAWVNSEKPKNWLKERRPDLYAKAFPEGHELSPRLQDVRRKLRQENVGPIIVKFLQAHPEVRGVFWGGAIAFTQRNLSPLEHKHMGSFTTNNKWELVNEIFAYPADLWMLTEEPLMDPLSHVDRVEVTDPEGTDLHFDVSEEQAAKWAKGSYIRGHILLYPDQAGGRYAYNVVDFPAQQEEWNPVEPRVLLNGVIGGTIGHGGWRPKMEIFYKDGTVVDVKGGGTWGELIKEFLSYPGINEAVYPHMKMPGYWHQFEIAAGTHPKFFRPTELFDTPQPPGMGHEEIIRSGIFHLAIGMEMISDPGSKGFPKVWWQFGAENDLPMRHSHHTHNYFSTYKVHLRNTDKWLTLVDKGHMTSLDNPEVRALASRYGDPDRLLAEDWIPEIPGINAPGRYEDYAADPWKHTKAVMDKVKAGTYEHFYPPATVETN
jgi:hypothetical protein